MPFQTDVGRVRAWFTSAIVDTGQERPMRSYAQVFTGIGGAMVRRSCEVRAPSECVQPFFVATAKFKPPGELHTERTTTTQTNYISLRQST